LGFQLLSMNGGTFKAQCQLRPTKQINLTCYWGA